jgi:hypothetical protein
MHLAIDRPKVHSCTGFPLEQATTHNVLLGDTGDEGKVPDQWE